MRRRTIHAILLRGSASVLCLTLGTVSAWAASQPATPKADDARPRLVVPEPVWDAGKVAPADRIVHDFELRNEGTAPLTVTDVRPACGCTVADFDATIAPGATGKVHAVLDPSSFNGAIAKGIIVLTNDPALPRIELTLKATIERLITVEPGWARFVQAQLSDPGMVEQRIYSASFDKLQIVDIESPYPFLEVTHREAEAERRNEQGVGPQYVLTFTLDYSNAPIGPLAEHVVVKTNHPREPEVFIPVSGFVRPIVVVTPNQADFGKIESEEPIEATMILKSYATGPLRVTGAETTVAGVTVEVEPRLEGREYDLHLTVDPSIARGEFSGTIRVKTDHPKQPVIEIPLKGVAV